MRIHSDILTTTKIKDALGDAQRKGHVAGHVRFAKLEAHGSRKRSGAVEVSIGTDNGESFISPVVAQYAEDNDSPRSVVNRIKRRNVRNGYFYDESCPRSATWHEWGHFIAELFAIDPRAIIGKYDQAESFYYQTYEEPMSNGYYDPMQAPCNGRAYDFLADIEDWEARTDNYNYWG